MAAALGLPHVELDAWWWGPGWRPVPLAAFQARVREAVAAPSWVVDGFYLDEAMVPLVWPAADVVVWLDLPRRTCVRRAVLRSVRRVLRRTPLWGGPNRQPASVLSPASVVRLVRRWPSYPARIEAALAVAAPAGPPVVRLRSDAEVRRWLEAFPGPPGRHR